MTIRESLLAVSAFPIPMRTIEAYALKRGVELDEEANTAKVADKSYKLVLADLYVWLFFAPNVSQGGQSYSLTESQKAEFRKLAKRLYAECGEAEDESLNGVQYGYMGSRL